MVSPRCYLQPAILDFFVQSPFESHRGDLMAATTKDVSFGDLKTRSNWPAEMNVFADQSDVIRRRAPGR